MKSMEFSRSYVNVKLMCLSVVTIMGIVLFLFLEQIPSHMQGKGSMIILSTPFLLFYLLINFRRIMNSPKYVVIDFDQKLVKVDEQSEYQFEQLKSVIITLRKTNFALYMMGSDGVLLQTKDYFNANMSMDDMKKCFGNFDNMHAYCEST